MAISNGIAGVRAARYAPAALFPDYSLTSEPAMDRLAPARPRTVASRHATRLSLALAALTLVPSTGCLHLLLATGIYMFDGGNRVDPECEVLLEKPRKRVVVFCRQPASQEFRHAGASRQIASKVSGLLVDNLEKKVEVVPQRQVDQWIDENDSDDFAELGKAVKADIVLEIDLSHFELFAGQTVYQGSTDVTLNVYDMKQNGSLLWTKEMGEFRYPVHAPIAIQGKSVSDFQREYVTILSDAIGKHFYKHDPHADFALDALADR